MKHVKRDLGPSMDCQRTWPTRYATPVNYLGKPHDEHQCLLDLNHGGGATNHVCVCGAHHEWDQADEDRVT